MRNNNKYPETDNPLLDPHLTRQHFSTKIFKVYLRCIEINYPHVDVHKICEKAGLPYEYLTDENNWVSTIFDNRFTKECIAATNDPDLPYKSGQMSLTIDGTGSLLYYVLRYTLSTTRIYKTLSAQILNFTKVLTMQILSKEANVIRIKYCPVNLPELSAAERDALIDNLENIYRNAVGYLTFVPVIHDNPEADIDHHTELSSEGFPELYMKVTYRDRNPMLRMVKPILSAILFLLCANVIRKIDLPPLLLEPVTVKWLLLSGLFTGTLFALLTGAFLKQRKIPIETQKTIAKLDAQYRDLQKAKEKIEDMNIALQQADKLKDDFLSNTSHELRTPLNGIIGIAESLLDGATGGLSDETNQNLQLIVSSGKRLADLVNDILDFSKLKNKDIILKKGPVDIRQLADVVLTISAPLTAGKALDLTNNIPEDFPFLYGDENRLHQILLNLVGNAVKFSEQGVISVRATVEGELARISVSDNGIGIPVDKQADIFKSFEQADSSIEREYGGTGLGLSVTKSLVEIHGGRIWVTSDPGQGATFFFTIPIAGQAVENRRPPQEQRRSLRIDELPEDDDTKKSPVRLGDLEKRNWSDDRRLVDAGPPEGLPDNRSGFHDRREPMIVNDLSGIHVLAVDDEPVNLQVIRNNLKMAGASVYAVHSGTEAIDTLRQMRPDIILLDIMMPKMNGYETAKHIRSLFSKEELPILYLTAKNQVRDLVDGFTSGGNDYITKPLSKNELMARIRFHVGLTRSRIKLAETEKKYRTILSNIEEGYFETDLNGNFTFWNESLIHMVKYGANELPDMNYGMLADKSTREVVFQVVNRVYRTGEPSKGFEFELLQKTGMTLSVEVSISLIRNAEGRPVGFRGLARDITDRREKEKAEKDRKTAEAATQAKSEFLANMSHEIRTPMNAIIGFSNLALETDFSEKQREYLKKIRSSAGSLLGIINDILDFSKIEAGKMTLESVAFQLHDVLETVTDMVAAKVAEKHLEMIVAVDRDIPSALIGDPLRLGQILLNLIGNALKFTEKGDITLHISREKQTSEGLTLRFSITDTGIGISADQKARLFSAFTQADSSTTRNYGGTGLGLTISKRMVEMMNGAIDFTSEVGRGSTFFFTAVFQRQAEVEQFPLLLPEDIRGLRTLVIDDIAVSRDHVVQVLNEFGCRAVGVETGQRAVMTMQEAARSKDPVGLVVTDWRPPPGMDALAFAIQLQKDPVFMRIPVIVKTIFCRRSDMEQAAAAGIKAVINKPITKHRLFETILEAFGKKDARNDDSDIPPSLVDDQKQAVLNGKRILLVDDNPLNQQVVAEILGNGGLIVEIACNGREALERIDSNGFDAVLMDVQMPIMDGYEATRRIRSDPRHRDLPIIAMTARTEKEDAGKCIAAGMNGYVDKTIDAAQLLTTLADWIRMPDDSFIPVTEPAPPIDRQQDWPDNPPGIDITAALRRLGGNRKMLSDLLFGFARDYADSALRIQEAYQNGDTEACLLSAHTLKGVSGQISAIDLQASADELEKAIRAGSPSDVEAGMNRFEKKLNQVMTSIEQLLPVADPPTADPTLRSGNGDSHKTASLVLELNQFLLENNFKALESLEALKTTMDTARWGILLQTLEDQINRFEFKQVQQTLARITDDDGDTGV